MEKLSSMLNIGKEIEKKLIAVGITTPQELKKAGTKAAFIRLKLQYPDLCLVFLYTLEGAITNTKYNELEKDVKEDLKSFYSDTMEASM